MWGATGAPGISSHASPPGTGTSPQPRLQEASLATPAARTGIQLIPALTRVPAFIDTEVDSDNAVSRVVASVPAGPWAGAVLYSQDARLAGKGMDIHFDRMMWRGMFLKVNAYALNEHTGMSSVVSDVNHRWFKHIVLPSILGGAGKGGVFTKTPTHRSFRETTAALLAGWECLMARRWLASLQAAWPNGAVSC